MDIWVAVETIGDAQGLEAERPRFFRTKDDLLEWLNCQYHNELADHLDIARRVQDWDGDDKLVITWDELDWSVTLFNVRNTWVGGVQ
jgi:hypothetical protein